MLSKCRPIQLNAPKNEAKESKNIGVNQQIKARLAANYDDVIMEEDTECTQEEVVSTQDDVGVNQKSTQKAKKESTHAKQTINLDECPVSVVAIQTLIDEMIQQQAFMRDIKMGLPRERCPIHKRIF